MSSNIAHKMTVPTMKVVANTSSGFKIINQCDFDPEVHRAYLPKKTTKAKRGRTSKHDNDKELLNEGGNNLNKELLNNDTSSEVLPSMIEADK